VLLKVVVSIVKDDMAICTSDSKRVYRYPAKAVRGPRRWLERELKPPFCRWDLRIYLLEVDVRGNESILENKNRLDDAAPC